MLGREITMDTKLYKETFINYVDKILDPHPSPFVDKFTTQAYVVSLTFG